MKKNELNGWVKEFKHLCVQDMDEAATMVENRSELEIFQAKSILEGEIDQYKQWQNIFGFISFGVAIISLVVGIANNAKIQMDLRTVYTVVISISIIIGFYVFTLCLSLKRAKCVTALSYLKSIRESLNSKRSQYYTQEL